MTYPASTPNTDSTSDTTEIPVATHSVLADGERSPAVFLLPAVGGCGVSTLAHSIAPFAETDMFPAADDPNMVVVVTTATYTGVQAAHRIVQQSNDGRAGGCQLLGLVVVTTAGGKIPKPVTQRLAPVESKVRHIWHVDYVDAWRCLPTEQLPVWDPTVTSNTEDARGARRRKKKTTAATEVPERVVSVATEICQEAVGLYQAGR